MPGLFLLLSASASVGAGQDAKSAPPPPTLASTLDRQVGSIEKLVTEAAEAMPEEKFSFTPESLKIPGSEYKGVRTFALEVRHIAASNYILFSNVTGEKIPDDWKGGNGPESLKTKAEILKFLRDSWAMGHRAATSLTPENMLQPAANGKNTRIQYATFGVAHAYDHYGQMVEYLRMNGIVPPASRENSK